MDNFWTIWDYQLFQVGAYVYTVGQFILLGLLLIFGYGLSKLIENLFSRRLTKTNLRPQAIQTLQRLLFYTLIVGVILAGLSLLHIPITVVRIC